MQETQVRSLSWEDPLEKEMAVHSNILAWKIPWARSLVGCCPWGHKESDTTEWLHFHFHTKLINIHGHTVVMETTEELQCDIYVLCSCYKSTILKKGSDKLKIYGDWKRLHDYLIKRFQTTQSRSEKKKNGLMVSIIDAWRILKMISHLNVEDNYGQHTIGEGIKSCILTT